MTANHLALESFRLKNFKAVRDSGPVRFGPLTVLIGDNGSGKSSLIEGLQTYQRIVTSGLDKAMQMWRGFEYVRNATVSHTDKVNNEGRNYQTDSIEFRVNHFTQHLQSHLLTVTASPNEDKVFIFEEEVGIDGKGEMTRNKEGKMFTPDGRRFGGGLTFPITFPISFGLETLTEGASFISSLQHYLDAYHLIASWQFVRLNPYAMGDPRPQRRTGGKIRLESDGSNIAEYLLDIRERDSDAFEGIIETLQYVLPYVRDLQPALTSELERAVYLQMTEDSYKIPGWLLSTGTLRILALLALFRHPEPPPLIIIEEIENGLDPRTIHLIVEELRNLTETGQTQVIATTHSPYLLDLLTLSHLVLVERVDGQPVFSRPADEEALKEWANNFGSGRLYTMNKLSHRERS